MIRLWITFIVLITCVDVGLTEQGTAKSCRIVSDSVVVINKVNIDSTMNIQDSLLIQYMTIKQFKDSLGKFESWGIYNIVNKYGFMGKYQFSPFMVRNFSDARLLNKKGILIADKQKFLHSPEIQEAAMDTVCGYYVKYIYQRGYDKYIGKEIDGVVVTMEGLMLGTHFSPLFLMYWLETEGETNMRDVNISLREYMKRFENRGRKVLIQQLVCK